MGGIRCSTANFVYCALDRIEMMDEDEEYE